MPKLPLVSLLSYVSWTAINWHFQETKTFGGYLFLFKYFLHTFLCHLPCTTTMPCFNTQQHQSLHLRLFSPRLFTYPAWCLSRHIQQLLCAPLFHLYLMNWPSPLARHRVFWPGTRMDGLCVWTLGESRAWCQMSVWRKAFLQWSCFLPLIIMGFREAVPGYPVWCKPSGMLINLIVLFFLDWKVFI